MALIFRSLGLSIQGIGRLIFRAIPLAGKGDKLHLFWVSTLGLGLLALVDIMEVGLEVVILLEPASPRPCINTPWHPHSLTDSPAPWPPSQPRSCLSLSFRKCLLQLALQILLLGFPGIFLFLQLLPASLVPGHKALQLSLHSAAALTPRAKSSAIVNSSLVTLMGFEVPKAAKSQNLTNVNLVVGSTLIKFVDNCWALREVPPATCDAAPVGFEMPVGSRGPGVWSLADRPPLGEEEWTNRPLFPNISRGGSHNLIWTAFSSLSLTNE
ncbi:LOW QUALITY PROTEIN: hypothetical protein Cgig2_010823 [Carnegiea gigantea]|uniref:Uncharacterized protein n=1 Tax=Carnegiea gigantea TaxID=171969 RepID=A0A9Q1JMD9_9CARY|nr:LOW QUALITY PROTEIN: hypothetical protein Cgig2_010823 [Carnegiea gigantea]